MESANIHHYLHGHGVQLVGSSSLATPSSSYGLGTTLHASSTTTPNSILNTNGGFNNSYSSEIPRQQQENTTSVISSSQYNPMTPDLNFNWVNFTTNSNNQSPEDVQLSRIKEELAANRYYTKYTELLSSSPTSSTDELSLRNDQQISAKFLHKSFSSNNLINTLSSQQGDLYSTDDVFGGIYPSVNVADLGSINNVSSGSNFNMNLQALDLLTSSRFGGSVVTSSQNHQIGFMRDDASSYGFDNMVQSHQVPLYTSNKISAPSNNNGGAESKRNSSKMEQAPKAQQTTATKKSRVEARASCPPFKVRKEKLGDRIAALQQLVAPFGKTDTASVLMEAIGYIKFLQNQVETLSVPYMKASRNKTSRVIKGVATDQNENYEESKRDLKSRGLCLVPLSCLSYIADGGGAAVWPPPHFGGATI